MIILGLSVDFAFAYIWWGALGGVYVFCLYLESRPLSFDCVHEVPWIVNAIS